MNDPPISNLEINVLREAALHPEEIIRVEGGTVWVGRVQVAWGFQVLAELVSKSAIDAKGGGYVLTDRGRELAKTYAQVG